MSAEIEAIFALPVALAETMLLTLRRTARVTPYTHTHTHTVYTQYTHTATQRKRVKALWL